mmetsp:Transcript_28377/g.79854  ORF Transcript_28377/g.79854 Transcript_28377/m.79854 type:complete len:211 (+) Transcript_28377:422-1054(+)
MASVSSTTSPMTQDVSSFFPPLPIGASGQPFGPGLVFAWHAITISSASRARSPSGVGPCPPGGKSWLHKAATSSKKRLSKTPSLPITMMSPSYAETQCTALPRSITSMVISSTKCSSILSSTRANWRGVWACPSMRCISVWHMASKRLPLPWSRRKMSSSQSPTVMMATIGCRLPCILVLLSSTASTKVVEPRVGDVRSYASLTSGIGPR